MDRRSGQGSPPKLREVFRSLERMRADLREQAVACVLDGEFYVFGSEE